MPRSMTGFGRATLAANGLRISMEVRSVNSRYFELSLRLPAPFRHLENACRQTVQKEISRGKLELRVSLSDHRDKTPELLPDLPRARAWLQAYQQLATAIGEESGSFLPYLLRQEELFQGSEEPLADEPEETLFWRVMEQMLADHRAMREREGENLAGDLLARLTALEGPLQHIRELAASYPQRCRERLAKRIEELLGESQMEEFYPGQRLAAEVALLVDKADIAEELTRLDSHFAQFRKILTTAEPVGKKLDFLIQEMNRESNTIGSKSGDLAVTNEVLRLKTGIEQLREQIQNLE